MAIDRSLLCVVALLWQLAVHYCVQWPYYVSRPFITVCSGPIMAIDRPLLSEVALLWQ